MFSNLCKLLLPYHSHKVAKSGTPRINLIISDHLGKIVLCNSSSVYCLQHYGRMHAYQVPIHRMVSKCFLIMALQLVLVCPISYACLVNFRQYYTVVNSFSQLFGFTILRQQIYYQVEYNHVVINTADFLTNHLFLS